MNLETELQHELGILVIVGVAIVIAIIVLTIIKFIKDKKQGAKLKKLKGKIVNLFNKIFKKEDKRLNSCYWIGFLIIYLELVYRIFVIGNLATWNALFVVLFSIPWIVLFSFLTCLFNEKAN